MTERRTHIWITAAIISTLPMLLLFAWFRLLNTWEPTAFDMFMYPLLFGGSYALVILAINRYLCGEPIGAFNLKDSSIGSDIGIGLILFVVLMAISLGLQYTVMPFLPPRPPTPEFQVLIDELRTNWIATVIWLGPVVWIGVALLEELHRTFLLRCLWKLDDGAVYRWFVIVFAAILIGALHIYQGWPGFVSVGAMSLFKGWYYHRYGRIWPLIISHALYDSAWIVFGVFLVG